MKMTLPALAFLLFPACSSAAGPLTYDCDGSPGRLSELNQSQAGPEYRISGQIRVNELVTNQRWTPAGNIDVESADEQDRAMLQLLAPERKAPLDVVLRLTNHGEVSTRTLGQIGLGEDLPFSMAVADGRVKVEIGTMRGEAAVALGPGARVGVSCTTGNFHFEDLRLENPDR